MGGHRQGYSEDVSADYAPAASRVSRNVRRGFGSSWSTFTRQKSRF